jgi:hypothetical protein
MNWLERYAQAEVGEENMVVESPAEEESDYSQVVFDGAAVNDIIESRLVAPLMNIVDQGAYDFLGQIPQDYLHVFLSSLANDGVLPMFMAVVRAYDASIVAEGTQNALDQLSGWFDRFEASGGNRKPFDTLRSEVSRIIDI